MPELESLIRTQTLYLENEIHDLNRSIDSYPPGRMNPYQNGIYTRYKILIPGQAPVSVSTKDQYTLDLMTRKRFFEAKLTDSSADLAICQKTLPLFEQHPRAMEQLLADKRMCRLLTARNPEVDLDEWSRDIGSQNPDHPEHLNVFTEADIMVRSKSEALIVTAALELQIPFLYEHRLVLPEGIFYPDFMLLNPKTRKVFYLEHFGLMDDDNYARAAYRKLQIFHKNGIRPGDNLICFFEYRNLPLSIVHVKNTLTDLVLNR